MGSQKEKMKLETNTGSLGNEVEELELSKQDVKTSHIE